MRELLYQSFTAHFLFAARKHTLLIVISPTVPAAQDMDHHFPVMVATDVSNNNPTPNSVYIVHLFQHCVGAPTPVQMKGSVQHQTFVIAQTDGMAPGVQ